ncbi:MAG: ATP-binding protein [Ferruginibacter sp.]
MTVTLLRLYKTILLPVILFLSCTGIQAQNIERFNSFSYSVNEGLLQSTMGDIAFDKNNFCWLSFPNGIQKFDGKNFTLVPVQPGLPDDKLVYFFKCKNGELLISHSQGISKYEIAANKFVQVYKNEASVETPVLFMGEDDDIIYFYSETGTITGISCHAFKVVKESKTGFPDYSSNADYRPKMSSNIINHKMALGIRSSVYLWDLQKEKLLYRSDSIPDISTFLTLKTESEVLYYNYKKNDAIYLYNFTTNKSDILFIKGKDSKPMGRCNIYPWQHKVLISFANKLYETDTTLTELKSELVNFQNQSLGGSSTISRIAEDNFGNLYLLTIMGGIKKIIGNNYPIKYYGTEKSEYNYIFSILPDKENNRILAGTTGNGLLVFDTLQRLIKHIKTLPGESRTFAPNAIIKDKKGDYLLFVAGEKKVWRLNSDLSGFKAIPISTSLPENKSGIFYFGNFLFQNEKEAIIQSQGKLFKTNFANNTVTEYQVTNGYTMGGLLYHSFIITHTNDELIYLDAETFKEIKRLPFKNTGYVRCFASDGPGNIYVGSNNGIFIIDSAGKILQHLTKKNGLPDDCIYAMVFDNAGFLWCSTNKGLFKLNRDNSILQLKKEDGLQENEFNTNAVAKAADGEIFFAGVNGISSFYADAITNFKGKINLLFTKIKVNNEEVFKDTAVWNINRIDLPYNQNTLSFDFVAMANNNPDQYIYQYKMEDIDEQWIQNNDMQTVRYFLLPGKYVFKIYASRFFEKDAKPMKEIVIIIHPPFWKTWWFRTLLGILVFSLMAFIINQFNKRRYERKLAQLESEHKVRLERERISRDLHDNIGAYANAVLYNTELLENEKEEQLREELMKDLKYASKDIITSLRETIWALKKDNYSAEDCLLRIRNFVQPLNRYYQQIHFEVEGNVPPEKILHYSRALNLVRIVQEAVTNAIKHADAKNINIISNTRENFWEMVVTDDGKGFDHETKPETAQGNGLSNMKQRAADASFDLSIRSWQGSGTSIIIRINGEKGI